jgi:hypothetical protein
MALQYIYTSEYVLGQRVLALLYLRELSTGFVASIMYFLRFLRLYPMRQ